MTSSWTRGSVVEPPEVYLGEWSAFVSGWPDGRRPDTTHLVGYRASTGKSRTSSAVVRYDADLRRAITSSGKVYQLVGQPNRASVSAFIRLEWLDINRCRYVRDATAEFS